MAENLIKMLTLTSGKAPVG